MPLSTRSRALWRHTGKVGFAVLVVYALTSWDFLKEPSPHFHFTDLAASFLDGDFQTQTPHRYARSKPQSSDRSGYLEAIKRATNNGRSGWNDWASFRVLTLKGGQQVRGVFPFKHDRGPRKHEFWTVGGKMMVIDVKRDLAIGCDAQRPRVRCDRVEYKISFPPFPAVVMMPFVAVWGYHTNDVWITLVFGALSAMLLLFWLNRLYAQGLIRHKVADRIWIVALFAFGTVAYYCAIRGAVWFTALTMGVTVHLLYLLVAQGARRPVAAGVLLGLGVATRTPLLFASSFFVLEALFEDGRWLGGDGWRGFQRTMVRLLQFAAPAATIGLALAWYNWIRWHNPFEFGHFYLLEGTRTPTRDHGLFNFFFLNHNLGAALTNLPRLSFNSPYIQISRHGLGLLACTPALFAMFGSPAGATPALQTDD
ncbi:MAG TPA: hypothetical protein DCQ06_02635, partial [Myxococcales bacterium]|nr:hypothetical protein [Myxococcales bacterium]